MGFWKQWRSKWFGTGEDGKRSNSFLWIVLLGLVGAALMILSSFLNFKEVEPAGDSRASPSTQPGKETFMGGAAKDKTPFREYEEAYESRLRDILRKVVGVGDVEVLITIESTEEIVVEKDSKENQQLTTEKDTNGANRNISQVTKEGKVVLYQVSGDQQPLVVKTIKPKVSGVLVVAKGAEDLTVKKMMIEAVARGIDVPVHRISILPRKTAE
ncbi:MULTISPECIES: stage III sporulation protein AG [unclassified Paenibacillus]|uniref:stage III sporulation protein AG n=1 Tax=unclassified Paenibacillus TaxID=185978 RepID=UPI00020D7C0B|nr:MULTISPECIES: stage III sporulation protein AG [unclassified Paenibacillus]EGL16682.1 stage III sporulation protein AG [Paenibacillus sp. HGF7]EPD80654.1 stage III sporulation protein AG [Paenibacillus sp. HGH0039]